MHGELRDEPEVGDERVLLRVQRRERDARWPIEQPVLDEHGRIPLGPDADERVARVARDEDAPIRVSGDAVGALER